MKLNYYNLMASKIQKIWRGYYVRKYVFDFYSRRRYIEALKLKNEIIRIELQEYIEHQTILHKRIQEERDKQMSEYNARKNHYLVSTYVQPGIYNSPFLPYKSDVPKHLPVPPIKPQGPFREPEEVQKQRYKPFQPSLRVATDIDSLQKAREILKAEEWVTRHHDDM
ncbi:hypothetical protein C0Q70_13969 [Pomacea canaliculata]|uniref:Spermatogenesis-associated protein 17 n=1 Tax=Pomacea canaliculata TaxID=400727 RepID=A0A2T7NYP4_POMCA|nr:hypothetical protein C0Q70_13969 [Pomacea canaliculata]